LDEYFFLRKTRYGIKTAQESESKKLEPAEEIEFKKYVGIHTQKKITNRWERIASRVRARELDPEKGKRKGSPYRQQWPLLGIAKHQSTSAASDGGKGEYIIGVTLEMD
jgi:hypothetical protein